MFLKTNYLDTAFRQLRLFCLLIVSGCLLLVGIVLFQSYHMIHQLQSGIYVLSNGQSFSAELHDQNENREVEAKDHISTFHEAFFSLDPDEKEIEATINKALYLADASARKIYESLKEENFYTSVISGNIRQQISIDSISLNMDHGMYYFQCYATEKITRPSNQTIRSLLTEGYLRPVSRSLHNPHGFLIEKWKILENRDLKTNAR